jgi:hypothetical protein
MSPLSSILAMTALALLPPVLATPLPAPGIGSEIGSTLCLEGCDEDYLVCENKVFLQLGGTLAQW